MIIERVGIRKVIQSIEGMMLSHWEELGEVENNTPKLELDINLLYRMEDAGRYQLYVCYHRGNIVGYIGYIITHGLHTSSVLYATTDAMYILPEYRNNFLCVGHRLLKKSNEILFNANVDLIHFNMNVRNDMSSMLNKMGYVKSQVTYVRGRE